MLLCATVLLIGYFNFCKHITLINSLKSSINFNCNNFHFPSENNLGQVGKRKENWMLKHLVQVTHDGAFVDEVVSVAIEVIIITMVTEVVDGEVEVDLEVSTLHNRIHVFIFEIFIIKWLSQIFLEFFSLKILFANFINLAFRYWNIF